MTEETEHELSIAAFLRQTGEQLPVQAGSDKELAEILCFSMLNGSPATDCVDQALAAIVHLAEVRAQDARTVADE